VQEVSRIFRRRMRFSSLTPHRFRFLGWSDGIPRSSTAVDGASSSSVVVNVDVNVDVECPVRAFRARGSVRCVTPCHALLGRAARRALALTLLHCLRSDVAVAGVGRRVQSGSSSGAVRRCGTPAPGAPPARFRGISGAAVQGAVGRRAAAEPVNDFETAHVQFTLEAPVSRSESWGD
jgi:hypothetical protein